MELGKTQTANTDNRVNQSTFKANTRNRFAKGNYEVWENTCDQVTVGDHCSAETRVADHRKHRKSRETSAGEKRGRPTYDRWSLVWPYFGLTKKMARNILADSTSQHFLYSLPLPSC